MTLGVRVAGGTNAGVRRPPEPPARDWIHYCTPHGRGVVLSGRFRNCPACYHRRPKRVGDTA